MYMTRDEKIEAQNREYSLKNRVKQAKVMHEVAFRAQKLAELNHSATGAELAQATHEVFQAKVRFEDALTELEAIYQEGQDE